MSKTCYITCNAKDENYQVLVAFSLYDPKLTLNLVTIWEEMWLEGVVEHHLSLLHPNHAYPPWLITWQREDLRA